MLNVHIFDISVRQENVVDRDTLRKKIEQIDDAEIEGNAIGTYQAVRTPTREHVAGVIEALNVSGIFEFPMPDEKALDYYVTGAPIWVESIDPETKIELSFYGQHVRIEYTFNPPDWLVEQPRMFQFWNRGRIAEQHIYRPSISRTGEVRSGIEGTAHTAAFKVSENEVPLFIDHRNSPLGAMRELMSDLIRQDEDNQRVIEEYLSSVKQESARLWALGLISEGDE
jgi:hypothetical protein